MNRLSAKIFVAFLFFNFTLSVNGQNKNAERIFNDVQKAFNEGEVSLIYGHLSKETYLSLFNGYSDYYSESQAFYVLKDFISFFSPLRIKFTHKITNTASPCAWGVLYYSSRGKNKTAQVFLSLTKSNGKYRISQFTIN